MKKVLDYLSYFFRSTDKVLLIFCLLSSAFGTLMVYSATFHTLTGGSSIPRDVRTMVFAILLGFILCMIISLIDADIICKLWPVWAAMGILLMVLVLLFGVGPSGRQDAKTWLDLKVFYFQPSELVKVFFIVTFSVHLHTVQGRINNIKNVIFLLIHAAIPFLLVAISGDDGSALVFAFIALGMLFIAGLSWKYLIAGVALIGAAVPLLWMKLDEFQKARFLCILHPEDYPTTAYQQNLGLSAMSNGGLFGKGFLHGAYTQSGAVPESQNDMIFTIIGEELGLWGCLLCLLLINLVIFRIIRNGKRSIQDYGQYMCYGIAFMIAVQTLINVAMCLRIGPVIGITLPFFSAGGSSTLCLYIGLGVAFSAYRSNFEASKENDFRLIGVSSPFNETFSDTKSATDRKVAGSTMVQTKPVTGVSGNQFAASDLINAAKYAWNKNKKGGSPSRGKPVKKAAKKPSQTPVMPKKAKAVKPAKPKQTGNGHSKTYNQSRTPQVYTNPSKKQYKD